MTSKRAHRALGRSLAIAATCLLSSGAGVAQDLPTDAQMQAAFGTVYNHLGLMEYCASRGFATATDLANARKAAVAAISGMTTSVGARSQEEVGARGVIVGRQLVGLMNPDDPAHPEMVREGRTMSLADNAKAQRTTEQALCRRMADQVAPLP